MSIIPRGQNNKATGVNSIPPFTIDGKADERFNKFYRSIDSVMNKLDLINSGDQSGREKEPQIRLEIRAAMDRGQCGIFNVAPFLECASQGKDNSECCRHRGIVQKTLCQYRKYMYTQLIPSGPQCEQFCRPTQGLSALGVQHIVCGSAVGDMLHCHHSGVRI
ncbi:hypothetical protein CRE_27950 [Caenorhabditis remanei]|uniref:Domain of unknown function DB domain-containing protein n=1 Tax=Caenorhabditis remanei TaxID=31234 RepID=E3NPR0_CAERE|nr:hypothetical protein CRE_27950 [Caenorhabditis remanei]